MNVNEQVQRVIAYSQNIPLEEVKINDLLNDWEDCKLPLGQTFGLTKENPRRCLARNVSFKFDEKAMSERYEDFIDNTGLYSDYPELMEFLDSQGLDSFYNNKVSYVYETEKGCINKGSKLIKSFKHFISDYGDLRFFQDKASELIQQKEITGDLWVSIHPLDFLSMSENNHNWRSCHNLQGDFRCGGLSLMTDWSSVIVYITEPNAADRKLPHFPEEVPWNSKKWRMIIFMSDFEQFMVASRQYPYNIEGILDRLNKLLGLDMLFGPFTNKAVNDDVNYRLDEYYYLMGKKILPAGAFIQDGRRNLAYNDLLNSSDYHKLFISHHRGIEGFDKVIVGSCVKCVRCGAELVETPDTMICGKCAEELFNGSTRNGSQESSKN